MRDRTITLKIGANITDLQGKLRKAQNDMKDWTNQAQKDLQQHRAQWSSLSNTVGGFGLAMVGMSALAVKGFAEFDKSMSKVKASGADAASNLDDLRAAAIKAGADTQYSAADAADAITDLAKAGVSAKDILAGGLSGALSLAASGAMDVGEAAETTSVALTQFKLGGNQASHVADLLAAGAGKAMGEVSDLGMALRQGGLVASQTGLSLEETVGALSSFASAGMLGSDAGTSLKTMLQRLTPQSAQAQAQFDELGISAYDAQGNFVGLANFAGQLRDKMKSLTPEARNAAMGVMFGADAVRGANVLYTEGQDGIQGWIDKVDDAGFAARQASTLTDNLSGDLERLRGSIDTVFIQSGSGANNALRGMAQSANAVVDAIGQIPEPALNAMVLLTGAGGLGLAGAAGMMKLVGALSDTKDALANLGKGATIAKIGIAGVGTALGAGFAILSAWASKSAEMSANSQELAATLEVVAGKVLRTDDTVEQLNHRLSFDTSGGAFGIGMKTAADRAATLGLTVADLSSYLAGNKDAIAKVNAEIDKYYLLGSGTEGIPLPMSAQEEAAVGLRSQLRQMNTELSDSERATLQKADADQQAGISANDHKTAIDGEVASLKSFNEELFATANALLQLSGNEVGWRAALDDTAETIKKNGEAERLKNGELDLSTKKGRENQTALNGLAQSSLTYVDSLVKQGASEKEIQGVLKKSRTSFIEQAEAAGMSSGAATQLADDLGLIPENTDAYIRTVLDEGGMNKWAQYDPKDKDAYINTYVRQFNNSRQGGQKLAGGGGVSGPGTATSDSIPAMLSNGEHVWTAAEVRGAGGHSGVQRLRSLALAGDLPRLRAGGPVDFASQVRGYAAGGMVHTSASNVSYINSTSTQASKVVYLTSTVNYPVAEPTSTATNRNLQYAAAVGM